MIITTFGEYLIKQSLKQDYHYRLHLKRNQPRHLKRSLLQIALSVLALMIRALTFTPS
jgi:hypothetical protein